MMRRLRIFGAALFDPRTPGWLKVFMAFAVLYGLSPLDLIPDLIPLGLADDLIVLLSALLIFLSGTKKIRRDLRGSI